MLSCVTPATWLVTVRYDPSNLDEQAGRLMTKCVDCRNGMGYSSGIRIPLAVVYAARDDVFGALYQSSYTQTLPEIAADMRDLGGLGPRTEPAERRPELGRVATFLRDGFRCGDARG